MKKIVLLAGFAFLGGCTAEESAVDDAPPRSTTVQSEVAAAREAAAGLPVVELDCPAGDEARGILFDLDKSGSPSAEDVLGGALIDRRNLPPSEFRRTAATKDAVQFSFPATGSKRAVVVATKAAEGWRAHDLRACRSLTLLPGEGP